MVRLALIALAAVAILVAAGCRDDGVIIATARAGGAGGSGTSGRGGSGGGAGVLGSGSSGTGGTGTTGAAGTNTAGTTGTAGSSAGSGGSGGSGGAAGQAGTTGVAGTSGVAGRGGTTGSAGTIGSAGTTGIGTGGTGTAGTTGVAGTSGVAGRGGTTGSAGTSALAGTTGTGTGGTGTAARFNSPTGVAVDGAGNVYVADTANHTIRKVTTAGVVTTLAGTAGQFGSADGTGAAARFNAPYGVAVDGTGNVYVGDIGNNAIRKVTAGGVVTTLAGTAGQFGSADGTGAAARFFRPAGVAVDGAGNVYVADEQNSTIRKVTAAGVVTTLAGLPGMGGSADGVGMAARFRLADGVAVDGAGNVYVADTNNETIRMVTAGGVVTTLAGSPGMRGNADGTGADARFYTPIGVAVDGTGNVYVTGVNNHTIRKITAAGVVTTLAGSPGMAGSADGTGAAAGFDVPAGVAVDGAGNVYVADQANHTIRKITAAGVVTTLAGAARMPGSSDG